MRSMLVVLAAVAATLAAGARSMRQSASPARVDRHVLQRVAAGHKAAAARPKCTWCRWRTTRNRLPGRHRRSREDGAESGERYDHARARPSCTSAPRRAAGRAAGLVGAGDTQDLQLRAYDERLCRAPDADAGREAAQGQVGLERVGRPAHAGRHQQLAAVPRSPQPDDGAAGKLGLRGEDVIIGVIDTGAVQEHPSFADTGITAAAGALVRRLPGWRGLSSGDCSGKLIGARWFVQGFTSASATWPRGEFFSARDSDGHGTHTASTAARQRRPASLNGVPVARSAAWRIARALAMYKACWTGPDSATSDGCASRTPLPRRMPR